MHIYVQKGFAMADSYNSRKPELVALRERQHNRNRAVALLGAMVAIATALALMVPAISMTHGDLICDNEEHTHSDACYEQVLACGQEEGEEHSHTGTCYETKLTCDKPEHTHSDACYAEPEPEPESQPEPDLQSNDDLPDAAAGTGAADQGDAPTGAADENEDAGKSPDALADADTSTNADSGVPAFDNTNAGAEPGSSTSDGADAEEPLAEGDEAGDDYPAQSFEADLVDAADAGKVILVVAVDAPKGALPAETTMTVEGIDASKLDDEVKAAISYEPELSGKAKASWTLAANVSFTDADGNEVEPAKDVKVKLSSPLVRDHSEAAFAREQQGVDDVAEAGGAGKLVVVHALDADKAREAGKLDEDGDPKRAELVDSVRLMNWDDDDKTKGSEDTLRLKVGESGPYAIVELEPLAAGGGDGALAAGEGEGNPAAEGDGGSVVVYDQEVRQFSKEVTDAEGNVTLTVEVEAPADALPEGATMQVTPVTSQKILDAAKEKAADEVDGIDAARAEVVAADITFFDADGRMVEPAADVHVSMSAPAVAEAAKDDSKANAPSELAVVHVADNKTAEVVGSADVDAATATAEFDSADFSVYALVYTVDFHWEVNGKTYNFSIPGGGFVSLEHLVEALGIAATDASGENGAGTAGNGAANENASAGEALATDVIGAYEQSLSVNSVEVSEATKQFVADVESVEFSTPSLVWVGRVDSATTVGGFKDANGLECEYSADLTEEQIANINDQVVEAGDWALIGLQPFTSEETLIVTMTNGDQFVVKVTDAQKPYKDVSTLETGTYIIYNAFDSSKKLAFLKNNGTSSYFSTTDGQALNASALDDYTWTVTKISEGKYTIKSTKNDSYLNLYGANGKYDQWANSAYAEVALSGSNGIVVTHDNKTLKRQSSGENIGKFYTANGSDGVGLTFFKIENDPSGGTIHDTGIELSDSEREQLSKWEKTIERFNTLTDYNKTAEVDDYDNRIYKIDIQADSGIMDFYRDVDLGLVLDVSNSMKFPSSLKALEDQQGNEYKAWMTEDALNAAYWAYQDYYNRQNCFYILSDPALTSTIYRVFWNGSKWQYQDASSNDPNKILDINDGTVFKEPYRQAYTLYYADDQKQRIVYLNDSVEQAVETLKKIVRPTEGPDDETANVRVAYNFFAGTKTTNGSISQYAIRGSNNFVDLRDPESSTFAVHPAGNEADGTRQDLALYDTISDPKLAANEFSWNSSSDVDRYVILVTDGAPNGVSMSDVEEAAAKLKAEDDVKIITVGLSTKDVDGGSTLLKTIADDVDNDGIKDFYEAEKASDLKHILLKILQTIMAKGMVKGKISDSIDSAFYPVNAQGNPLSVGVYNESGKVDGAQISDYVANGTPIGTHQNETFYTWELVNGKWKITWYNQEIGWNDNDPSTGNPWIGTVYVKAKEDYLGGNLIETNDGNAQIEPTGIKLVINGTPESTWRPLENMTPVNLPVPRVNVHNLETNENSTTFTVYKGTTVTPKEQIEALWNAIPIEEVVSASESGQHKRTTGSSANVGIAGNGETFTLGSLMSEVAPSFNIDTLIDQVGVSNSSASQEFTYTAYGHESGKITVKVERTAGNQTPAAHTADTVGTPVEQYKVTFTYKPYTETERMNDKVKDPTDENHHNGTAGRGAEETGTMTSENTHTINVFQKGIKITKVDKTDTNQPLPGAVFELFRADAAGQADVSAYNLPSGTYSKVGRDLTADENGVIAINPVIPDADSAASDKTLYQPNIDVGATSGTSHDTVFYLVEKAPPTIDGEAYAKMPGAIKFTMTLSEDKGTDSAATLYNWMQTAAIAAGDYGNGSTAYLVEDAEHTITGTNADIYAYKIKNGRPTNITLIKVDKTTQNSIGGAKFSLLRGSENVDLTQLVITAITNGASITPEDYDLNGTIIKVVTVPEGGIRIAGLVDDSYTLREVTAPAGYIITGSDKTFKTENGAIKNADDTDHPNEYVDIAFKVENQAGQSLPNTGGPGTTPFYLFGTMLVVLAGAGMLTMRKRRKAA